jgi:uncharacterized protein (TIGR02646 family)
MIRVAKSTNIPAELTNKGVPATAINCQAYLADPAGYDTGNVKFSHNPGIYGHPSVKQQLIDEQHGKCCFCEADFTANGYGDVEHFRPKGGFTRDRSGKLIRPGYYWLAYDWDNLFFSCQICNQQFKKNYFPLEDEVERATTHTADYRRELPLLIHPSTDEPMNHITFNRHVPVAKNKRGQVSIITFGIDRPGLNSIREAYLKNVQNNKALANFEPDAISEFQRTELMKLFKLDWKTIEALILTAKAFMAVAAEDTQPFAGMVRANSKN